MTVCVCFTTNEQNGIIHRVACPHSSSRQPSNLLHFFFFFCVSELFLFIFQHEAKPEGDRPQIYMPISLTPPLLTIKAEIKFKKN
jgi:hypothetical protein